MPFLHSSDIETQTVSKYELVGLKTKLIIVAISSILGGILLQTWDWTMVLYFGHGFGQDLIENVFKYSDSDAPDLSLSFCFGLGKANDMGPKLDEAPD
jgi:hypothetical protein